MKPNKSSKRSIFLLNIDCMSVIDNTGLFWLPFCPSGWTDECVMF